MIKVSRIRAALLLLCSFVHVLLHLVHGLRHDQLFTLNQPSDQECLSLDSISTTFRNLTSEEIELLQYVCITPADIAASEGGVSGLEARQGIPPGVQCQPTTWCDGSICTTVCARGSVVIDPWLQRAIRLQTRLSHSLPFCFTSFSGTHNSAITLADGYGNLDEYFAKLFKYVKWAGGDISHSRLQTNDQWLSVTDQLNLGVRMVELDTHWVGGDLRIAHCGGLHVEALNSLVKALNLVAKILHRKIQWDTETLGCSPSLSSIPALKQRLLSDALTEIRTWVDKPENYGEFLILYFDDQPDLVTWGVAGKLQDAVLQAFHREMIFTQEDLAAHQGAWPTAAKMVSSGKRVMFVSGIDYGEATAPTIFPKSDAICGWTEFGLDSMDGVPECQVHPQGDVQRPEFFSGSLLRVVSCELWYGPLNCDFNWSHHDEEYLDEVSLPHVLGCGLNAPSPDLLTPQRAAAGIWTWAPGHPYTPPPFDNILDNESQLEDDEQFGGCGVLSASDGRWRAVTCRAILPSACRRKGAKLEWDSMWVLGSGPRGNCPRGSEFDVPRHPRENYILAELVRSSGSDAAWLPLSAPDWNIRNLPLLLGEEEGGIVNEY